MCNLFSGHVCTEPGRNWGKVLVITGVHHEKDREHKSVSRCGENLIAWETVEKADVTSGVKIVHTSGQTVQEQEKQALIEIVNAWILKKGDQFFYGKVLAHINSGGNADLSGCTGLTTLDGVTFGGYADLSGCKPEFIAAVKSLGVRVYE